MYLCIFFGLLFTRVSLARVWVIACLEGRCPEEYFCHEQICKRCIKCDLLFRKGSSCVTDFNKCGDCLEGYEEVLITNFSNVKKPCKQVKKKVKLKLCNESNCPKNNYCSEESECIKCFDCSLLNRAPPDDKCAKGLNECGSCLIGYSEVSVTTEARYKPCEINTQIVSEMGKEIQLNVFAIIFVLSGLWFVLSVAVAIFLVRKYFKGRVSTKENIHQPPTNPSAPPLHLIDTPRCMKKTEGICPDLKYMEEKKQQAKVFKLPSASYYYSYNNERTVSTDNESNDAVMENSNENIPRSYVPSNSAQPEEANCSLGIVSNRHSELAVNELGIDLVQPNESIAEESESPITNPVSVDVTDRPQPSESGNEDGVDLSETQNEEQTQGD